MIQGELFSKQSRADAFKSGNKKELDSQALSLLNTCNGLTADELSEITGWALTTSRPALSRLKDRGLVKIIGRRKVPGSVALLQPTGQ